MKRTTVLAWLICGIFALFASYGHAEDTDLGYVWKEGFLEKDYPIDMSMVDKVESQMTQKWLSMQMIILDNGWMRLYGVGDEEGRYSQGKGGNVQMKFISKGKELVTVGMKWGDGDKEASRKLHEMFQQILAKISDGSSGQKEKATDSQHKTPRETATKANQGQSSAHNLAQQEDVVANQIDASGVGTRFAVGDLKPTASAAGFHMMDDASKSESGEATFVMGASAKPSRGRATIKGDGTIVKETATDNIPMSILTTDLKPQPDFSDGSIIRFSGTVDSKMLSRMLNVPDAAKLAKMNLVFIGDGDSENRLTFLFSSKHGLVYLRGKGKVLQNGKETQLGQ